MTNSRRRPPETPRSQSGGRTPRRQSGSQSSYGRSSQRRSVSPLALVVVAVVAVLVVVSILLFIIRPGSDGNDQATVASTTSSIPQFTPDSAEMMQPTLVVTSEAASSSEPEATNGGEDSTEFDLVKVRRQLLELINADRVAAGLQPLEIDAVAETAAQGHADEMAALGYLSHWNVDGFGPDWRYSRSGGRDAVQESIANYYLQSQADSVDAPVEWTRVVVEIHQALRNDEHYRQNMLAPNHTHVGIGLAVNQVTGQVRVAQEFVSRLVNIDPIPTRVLRGERIVLKGRLLDGGTNPVVTIAFEPAPQPLSLATLNTLGYFVSPANTVETVPVSVTEKGEFVAEISLSGPPGLYHIRTTVDRSTQSSLLASDIIVELAP